MIRVGKERKSREEEKKRERDAHLSSLVFGERENAFTGQLCGNICWNPIEQRRERREKGEKEREEERAKAAVRKTVHHLTGADKK